MPNCGMNPAMGLFFARFEYTRVFPTPRQTGITGYNIFKNSQQYVRRPTTGRLDDSFDGVGAPILDYRITRGEL